MLYVSDSKTRAGGTMPKEENSVNGKMQLMLYKEMLDGMVVEGLRQHALEQRTKQRASAEADVEFQILDDTADDDVVCLDPKEDADDISRPLENGEKASQTVAQQCQKTDARISTTVDRFTWKDLFDHLSLDPTQPFTDGFLEQSRLLVQGNNLSAAVANAETLQQMTSCWAEYVSKLGLGTIDPTQTEEQIEEALEKEVGGRRIGRSEKLLTLVYRRVGTSKKKKKRGNRRSATETGGESGSRSKRGKRRKRGDNALDENDAVAAKIASDSDSPPSEEPTQIAVDVTEVENERLLQLAIAESLATPSTTNQRSQSVTVDGDVGAPEADMEVQDEPLPATLLPPEVYDATQQRAMQRSSTHEPVQAEVTGDPTAAKTSTEIEVEKSTEDAEGSIIGSQRFAYSRDLLSEHIDKILQFWTGSREPVGVSIENTTRCGWCEFEDGCEWR
jgi:exonuclease V